MSPAGALVMGENQDIFHTMKTNLPMRRLKPDPVPQALLQEILNAVSCVPNSTNTQPYKFPVVRDAATKMLFGERYNAALHSRYARYGWGAAHRLPRGILWHP